MAVEHEEQLVGYVVMPDELALQLGELDFLSIEFADELRRPLFVELGELRFEVDFLVFHVLTPDWDRSSSISIPRSIMASVTKRLVSRWSARMSAAASS